MILIPAPLNWCPHIYIYTHTHTHGNSETTSCNGICYFTTYLSITVVTHREIARIVSHTRLSHIAAHREPGGTIWVLTLQDGVAPCDWHVVDNPLLHVVLMDMVIQELDLLFVLF